MREAQTEVLVVGAGPVGLWAALVLSKAGVQVTILDREARTASRSYACALHPATLDLLDSAGVLDGLLAAGKKIEKVAFYDGNTRKAELRFADLKCRHPFLLVLPQEALERTLEEQLRSAGVRVLWNHRFESLTEEQENVSAAVDELGGTGTGYIVPHWETVVKERSSLLAQFVIGADGYNSRVRHALGIDYEKFAGATSFAAFEFETDVAMEPELRVVLGPTTNILWPLAGQKCRWTFQILPSELNTEFPEKERRAARFAQENVDERIRQYVQKVAGKRAPWFKGAVQEIAWCTEVSFEQRLVRQFGRNRVWLAGDAAHQTGPAGVQSMNAGFAEAHFLAKAMTRILRQESGLGSLAAYERQQRLNWERLLGRTGGLRARPDTDPWIRENLVSILPCLPASGPDLGSLAGQLKLDAP